MHLGPLDPGRAEPLDADPVVDMMIGVLWDGFDHPELWQLTHGLLARTPGLAAAARRRLAGAGEAERAALLRLLSLVDERRGPPADWPPERERRGR